MTLKVNRVEIKELNGKRYAFYLTVVKIAGEPCAFWSHHHCDAMPDNQAKKAFVREHFDEVATLVAQKMKNELVKS